MKVNLFFLSAFFVFVININIFAETKTPDIHEEYSADKILGFTWFLLSKKEFYRAYSELKRLEAYYPDYLNKNRLLVAELYILFHGRQFGKIENMKFNDKEDLTGRFFYNIFKADVFLERNDYQRAEKTVKTFIPADNDIELQKYYTKRILLTKLLLGKIDEAENFIKNRKQEFDKTSYEKYIELIKYTSRKFETFKRPCIALLLGFVPGMGYIYSDNRPTGIFAFVIVSIFSAITYLSFRTDNEHIGIFVGAATTFFYTGSIVGGYLAARDYNKRLIEDTSERLCDDLVIEKDREEIFRKYGLPR